VWHDRVYTVPAAGGTPAVFAAMDPATEVDVHGLAVISPARVLAATHHRDGSEALDVIESGRRTAVGPVGSFGSLQYAPGFILFQRASPNAGVWALPFTGTRADQSAASLIEPGADAFSTAADGTIVVRVPAPSRASLVWLDRQGALTDVPGTSFEAARDPGVAVSPDGTRAAISSGGRLIVRDLATGADRPLTEARVEDAPPTGIRPVRPQWLASGDEVLYGAGTLDAPSLVAHRADGTSAPRPIAAGFAGAVSPDGRMLLLLVDEHGRGRLRRADLRPDGTAGPLQRVFMEAFEPNVTDVAWSPDGQRFAYSALVEPGGKSNVYVSSYPDTTKRWMLDQGATRPRFGKDPHQLYFVAAMTGDRSRPYGTLTAADLALDGNVRIVNSAVLVKGSDAGAPRPGSYDVGPDGRLLLLKPMPLAPGEAARAIVIQHWQTAFGR
jgi:hypothetical protein